MAVEKENLELVKLLLKQRKIKINFKCTYYKYHHNNKIMEKRTALDLAKVNKNMEIIHLLSKK